MDTLLVGSEMSDEVLQFDLSDGSLIGTLISAGTGDAQLPKPTGIAVGPDGLIYVASAYTWQIKQYSASGVFIQNLSDSGGLVNAPQGIAFGTSGQYLYVANSGSNSILRFDFVANTFSIFAQEHGLDYPCGLAFSRLTASTISTLRVLRPTRCCNGMRTGPLFQSLLMMLRPRPTYYLIQTETCLSLRREAL